jgi:hypothetical protein
MATASAPPAKRTKKAAAKQSKKVATKKVEGTS